MRTTVIDFKCPMCAGILRYDSESGKLLCDNCGHTQDILEAPEVERDEEDTIAPEDQEFVCDSCGAVLVADPEVTSTCCAYCGSNVAIGERLKGKFAPDKVIPFTVSKEEAKAAYKKWAKNGLLTPRDFMTEKRLGEITGIYVPFWLYDMNVSAEAQCLCTKKRSKRQGDYIIQETDYYNVYRQANLNYEKVPADASVKMDDTTMDCLEPYNYAELKNFTPEYLAGFQAERYGMNAEELSGRVKGRVRNYAEQYLASTITGYASVTYQKRECVAEEMKHYYTLLPVWILQYKYKGEEKSYTMNGQTGKIVGKAPISKGKIAKWVSILYGCSFLIFALLAYLIV